MQKSATLKRELLVGITFNSVLPKIFRALQIVICTKINMRFVKELYLVFDGV